RSAATPPASSSSTSTTSGTPWTTDVHRGLSPGAAPAAGAGHCKCVKEVALKIAHFRVEVNERNFGEPSSGLDPKTQALIFQGENDPAGLSQKVDVRTSVHRHLGERPMEGEGEVDQRIPGFPHLDSLELQRKIPRN